MHSSTGKMDQIHGEQHGVRVIINENKNIDSQIKTTTQYSLEVDFRTYFRRKNIITMLETYKMLYGYK